MSSAAWYPKDWALPWYERPESARTAQHRHMMESKAMVYEECEQDGSHAVGVRRAIKILKWKI